MGALTSGRAKAAREGLGDRSSPRRPRSLKLDPALFRIRGLLCPFIRASSAAVCFSPPTKKAAGQTMTTAAAVARPSLVRCLSCEPDNVAALVDMA
jgi:hypothetical protein